MKTGKEPLQAHFRMLCGLRRLREVSEKQLQPFCAKYGLTTQGLRVLMTLYMEGDKTISALGQCTCMAGANCSALCKRLEGEGYLVRRRAREDERQVLVDLSDEGRRLMQDVAAGYAETQARFTGEASQEITQILSSMDALLAIMEQDKGDTA